MRLRNKPQAKNYLEKSKFIIKNPKNNYFSFFKRNKKLFIEIGMGKGKFIFENAKKNKNINFIGMEKEKSVIYIPAKKFDLNENKNIKNLKLINSDAKDLKFWFKSEKIDKIFINFPDPWPKKKHSKRRLVFVDFLTLYWDILKIDGTIEFKTDQKFLFDFFLEQIIIFKKFEISYKSLDLHENSKEIITTEYENRFISENKKIYFLKLKKII